MRSLNLTVVGLFFPDAEWVGRADTVMSASGTRAAFMVPVSSRGSATARKAGVAFSAIRVSSQPLPESLFYNTESKWLFRASAPCASLTG